MTTQTHTPLREGPQFRLVKFFSVASFVVLIGFSFPFSVVLSQRAKEIMLKSHENNAILVGQNLNRQVFQKYTLPIATRPSGQSRLSDQDQSALMDQIVRNTIQGFNVDLVNIYDIGKGVIAYSMDPKLIGVKPNKNKGYLKAVKGELSSGMITSNEQLWGIDIDAVGAGEKLRTYIPFRGRDPFTGRVLILGVFELIQDLTDQYKAIVRFQYLIFGLSTIIFGLIFLALILIVRKAEKTIEQRAEEQRALQEQLHQAERLAALGEMVAGVSHEIKNPLGIIRSTSELLGEMPDASETQKRLSGVITEESTRLNRIVTEFLDFARPQAPNLRECNLAEIIEKNLSFLNPELEKKGIVIRNELDGKSYPLMADQDLLYRAFLNAFINAMHAMDEGGFITVGASTKRGYYVLEIEDTGTGISEKHQKKIFNPFFTTKEKGSGLGLSIVQKLIEAHRGTVAIESKEGMGAKVRIHLPRW